MKSYGHHPLKIYLHPCDDKSHELHACYLWRISFTIEAPAAALCFNNEQSQKWFQALQFCCFFLSFHIICKQQFYDKKQKRPPPEMCHTQTHALPSTPTKLFFKHFEKKASKWMKFIFYFVQFSVCSSIMLKWVCNIYDMCTPDRFQTFEKSILFNPLREYLNRQPDIKKKNEITTFTSTTTSISFFYCLVCVKSLCHNFYVKDWKIMSTNSFT